MRTRRSCRESRSKHLSGFELPQTRMTFCRHRSLAEFYREKINAGSERLRGRALIPLCTASSRIFAARASRRTYRVFLLPSPCPSLTRGVKNRDLALVESSGEKRSPYHRHRTDFLAAMSRLPILSARATRARIYKRCCFNVRFWTYFKSSGLQSLTPFKSLTPLNSRLKNFRLLSLLSVYKYFTLRGSLKAVAIKLDTPQPEPCARYRSQRCWLSAALR